MQLLRWTTVSLLALVLASACGAVKGHNPDGGGGGGGGDANIDPNADFTITAAPTALTIPIASSAKVTVTVNRTGTTGDITLSATGLGANLTADFSPAAIPEGSSTADVTITVIGGTAAGTSTVSLTGTAGTKTHSADVSVTSTTITVNGVVRGNRSGIKVVLPGKGATTSAANGTFTFTDVTPPYDLYTYAIGGCGSGNPPNVYYYDGLTRTDPTVTAAFHASSCLNVFPFCTAPAPNSNVSGTKSGAGNNTDEVVFVWDQGSFGSPVLNTNGSFSGNATWCSGNTVTGNLYALQLNRKTNGAPNTFLGYAKTQATYTSGSAATTNLTFANITTSTITGTLNAPAGLPAPAVQLNQQLAGTTYVNLWSATTTAIDAGFPAIGGTAAALYASSSLNGTGQSMYVQPLTATATINYTMPSPAALATPADAATGVTTTTSFTWTASANVLSLVTFSAGSTAYFVYTTKNNLMIPVIQEAPLPSAVSGNWTITGFVPDASATTSVNDAAATTDLEGVSVNDFAGPAHAICTSVVRTFTTQ